MPPETHHSEESLNDSISPHRGRDRRLWHAASSILAWALVIAVLCTATWGFGRMQSEAPAWLRTGGDRAHGAGTSPEIVIHWPPMPANVVAEARRQGHSGPITWLDRDSREEIERIVRLLATADPFDIDSLRAVHEGLMSTGWFAEPVSVRRTSHGRVEVEGVWRIPVAAVRTETGDRLVTRSGRLLSPQYLPDRSGLKVVLGVTGSHPALGEAWPIGDVQAGLELLEFLRTMPGYEQVYGVDVGDFVGTGSLTVVTNTGTRVLWGGRLGEFHPGQAPDDAKRLRLAELFVRYGRLDAGQAMIDLRLEDGPYVVLREHNARQARAER